MSRTLALPSWLNRHTLNTSAVVVGGVGVVAALIIWLSAAMTQIQYRDAMAKTNAVVESYNALITKENAYTSAAKNTATSDAEFVSATEQYNATITAYTAKVTALKNSWVVSDQSVQGSYTAFMKKHDSFVSANAERETVMAALRQVTLHCSKQTLGAMDTSDLSKLSEAYEKTFTPCVKAITTLANAKSTTVGAVGKQYASYFSDVKARTEAMQAAYAAGDRTKFEAEYKQFLNLAESITTYTDMSKIYTYYRDILPGNELTLLTTLLAQKVA